jgi:hypothetical protein
MNNYIKYVQVNVLNLLVARIDFASGLNILSGENGTLKTRLLQTIRSHIPAPIQVASPTFDPPPQVINVVASSDPTSQLRVQAISPKRNSERRNIENIIQYLRSQNITIDTFINQRAAAQINDRAFEPYPALGDLYYALYEKMCRDGGNQKEKMRVVTSEFNKVIMSIFPEYKLDSEWGDVSGTPRISLLKKSTNKVPLEDLSLGEQEILSLVTNLYTSKDFYDVYLIDEPEIHLNWHLEERLFEFFNDFCDEYNKQIIVVTHSRAIFKSKFLKKTQFLFWGEDTKISVGSDITEDQRRRIAGEAIDIIKLGNFSIRTFFVEDEHHKDVIETLAHFQGRKVAVSICGNSPNIKSLYKLSKTEGGWDNAFFLTDGDNEGNPFPGEAQFIHLDKYCIENYLLDLDIATKILGKTRAELSSLLLNSILDCRNKIFAKNKYLEFLLDRLTLEDIDSPFLGKLDASIIFPTFLRKIGMTFLNYVNQYISLCQRENKLNPILPEKLIEAVEGASEKEITSEDARD